MDMASYNYQQESNMDKEWTLQYDLRVKNWFILC